MRPSRVWINTHALARTLAYAEQAEPPPGELLGAQRALASQNGPKGRWTMLVKLGCEEILDRIDEGEGVRHPHYTLRTFMRCLSRADELTGVWAIEADDLARVCKVPQALVYSVLIDLERLGAITRIRKNGQLRGIELTRKVKELPAQRARNGGRVAAA